MAAIGIEVLTGSDGLLHVSGHPNRGELIEMYGWAKPKAAVPVHGELDICLPEVGKDIKSNPFVRVMEIWLGCAQQY